MPTGVYRRTEKHKKIARKNIAKAREVALKLPRTLIQREVCRKMGKAAKTQKQRESIRELGKIPNIFADTIIEHHNDLCHGAERPDDVSCMTNSEHGKLHAKLQCQDRHIRVLGQKRDNKGRFI